MKFGFSRQIFENTQISNLIKIHPLGAELFRADRRTDMTNLIADFGKCAKARTNGTAKRSIVHRTVIMRCMRVLWAVGGGDVTACVKAGLGTGGVRRC
jgi:hypothetical protein